MTTTMNPAAAGTVAATAPLTQPGTGASSAFASTAPGGGVHHPNVEQWRSIVDYFFTQAGYGNEVDYALMVMWGESNGLPTATGPALSNGAKAHGLFQHLDNYWPERVRAASQYWRAKGITIGSDPNDPTTNIAVAAWLRATSSANGWGHWAVTYDWYKPGAWGAETYWDGYEYQNLQVPSSGTPPRGDGQTSTSGAGFMGFYHPVPGARPGANGVFGSDRHNSDGSIRPHDGHDYGGQLGQPIYAAAGGTAHLEQSPNGGWKITIDHGQGWDSRYMHLGSKDGKVSPYAVTDGQQVAPGQVIGYMGDTGNAEGVHLHFEIRRNGTALDPTGFNILDQVRGGDGTTPGLSGPVSQGQQPLTRTEHARQLLGATLNSVSMAVAGGSRTSLDSIKANRLGQVPVPQSAEDLDRITLTEDDLDEGVY